jgi:transcriptional regulator with PAS, ATPase and Fis domain
MAGREDVLQAKHLPVFFLGLTKRPAKSESLILKNIKADSEKEAVLHAMRISNYNKNKASKLLGIHRTALYKKMKKFIFPSTRWKCRIIPTCIILTTLSANP